MCFIVYRQREEEGRSETEEDEDGGSESPGTSGEEDNGEDYFFWLF